MHFMVKVIASSFVRSARAADTNVLIWYKSRSTPAVAVPCPLPPEQQRGLYLLGCALADHSPSHLQVLPRINGSRFADDESWRETARLMAYIELSISERHRMIGSDPHANPLRSMEHVFTSQSKKNHSFDSVTISAKLAERFSKGVRNSLEPADGNFILSGLGYSFMQRAVDSALVKPMSSDDKLKNGIFSSMVKKAWARAVEEVQSELDSSVGKFGSSKEVNERRLRVSFSRGVQKLVQIATEDEDAVAKKKVQEYESRRDAGRSGHLRWAELKDRMKLRLPPMGSDNWKEPSRPQLACSLPNGTSFRKNRDIKPALMTSADMARSMGVGLNTGYAHALSGNVADLEKSRKKLIAEGFIYLENFADPETGEVTEEAREQYRAALRAHQEKLERARAQKKAQDQEAYWSWVETKEGAELAKECMAIMPVVLDFADPNTIQADAPQKVGGAVGTGMDTKSVVSSLASTMDGNKIGVDKPLLGRPPSNDEFELWRAVGYAAKAIDRSLMVEWCRWSAPLFSKADCLSEWARFKPAKHEADIIEWKKQQEEEEKKKQIAKEKADRELGILPRPKTAGDSTSRSGTATILPGGVALELAIYKPPKVAEPEVWTKEDRKKALQLLQTLVKEHRKIQEFRRTARNEKAPVLPVLRRRAEAESLPTFIHGHDGAVKRLQHDLAMAEGRGLPMVGGSGVGSELVLQWFVGEDDIDAGPALGSAAFPAAPAGGAMPASSSSSMADEEAEEQVEGEARPVEGTAKLVGRLHSAAGLNDSLGGGSSLATGELPHSGPFQPPYVIVVETCGVAGSKKQREGDWTRVFVDPPEAAMSILTSTPGTGYVPLSAKGQGAGVIPPLPGSSLPEWDENPKRLRGAIRITGLMPNTSYGYRVRAYSRAGASAYAFGVFTTAAPPPPAPVICYSTLVPRHLLPVSAAGLPGETIAELSAPPTDVDAITLCWERRVDFRRGMLHMLRVFFYCLAVGGGGQAGQKYSSSRKTADKSGGRAQDEQAYEDDAAELGSATGLDGDNQYDQDEEQQVHASVLNRPPMRDESTEKIPATLFTTARVQRSVLLGYISIEVGLRNWLASCISVADHWPENPDAVMPAEFTSGAGQRFRLPARFKVALSTPISVLEALVRDTRPYLAWDEVCAMFEHDLEDDDPLDLVLAGTKLGKELGLGDAKGQGLPVSDDVEPKQHFSVMGGTTSVLSVQRFQLKKSMSITRITDEIIRTARARPASAGSALNSTLTSTAGRGGLPPAGGTARGGSSMRPQTAGGELTQQLSLIRTQRRSSNVSLKSTASSAQKHMASALQLHKPTSDVTLKYSLLQCVSDGPRGQEWQEVFVGIRSIKRVDKLLHGTSYAFKVQAVNQDGQGSLFGPSAIVTTSLPAPQNLRFIGRVTSTSIHLAWDEVSSANALQTMRAMSSTKSPSGGDGDDAVEGKGPASPSKGADIDAVLQALLEKSKAERAPTKDGLHGKSKEPKESGKEAIGTDIFSSLSRALEVREGDGGVGVDVARYWQRYDTEGQGVLPVKYIRGLLADLGAYSETTELVDAALEDGPVALVASGERAAGSGPGEWRLHAALSCLDPSSSGLVTYTDFVDWWNAVDAAIARQRGISIADQLEQKALAAGKAPGSNKSRRASVAAVAGQVEQLDALANGLSRALGEHTQVGDLSFAITYVVEARRLLTKQEAAMVASGAPLPGALQQATVPQKNKKAAGGTAVGSGSSMGGTRGAGMNRSGAEEVPEDVLGATGRTDTGSTRMGSTGGSGAPRPGRRMSIIGTVIEETVLPTPSPEQLAKAPLYSAWSVVFMGPGTALNLGDLLPNNEYQLRVSAMGRHSFSVPSKILSVNLPPLPPFAPVLVKTEPRGVTLRWYPGELGADKFEVQVKMMDSLKRDIDAIDEDGKVDESLMLKITAGTDAVAMAPTGVLYKGRNVSEQAARKFATNRHYQRMLAAGAFGIGAQAERTEQELWLEHPEETWAVMYTGVHTFAQITGLYANSVYHMRVIAYNAAGVPSRASPETQVVTGGNGSSEAITVGNAQRMFVVECPPLPITDPRAPHLKGKQPLALQDVVLGDAILFTEDVFVEKVAEVDPYHPAGPKEVPEHAPRAEFYCSRTIAAVVIGDSASGMTTGQGHCSNLGGLNGPVPVGMTAKAFNKSGYLAALQTTKIKTVNGKEVISVRPASASIRRDKDAISGSTDSGVEHRGPVTCLEDALSARQLSLQIEFCTVSKSRAANLGMAYPHGAIIKRVAKDLAGLDMYRTMWEDEAGRWTLAEEMRASFDK